MPHDPFTAAPPQPARDAANEPAAPDSAAGPSASAGLLDLPDELLLHIAGKMDDARDRMRFSRTNKRLREVMHDSPEKNAAENQYGQDLYLELASARRGRGLPELCRQVGIYLTRPHPTAPDRTRPPSPDRRQTGRKGRFGRAALVDDADFRRPEHDDRAVQPHARSLRMTGVGEPQPLERIDRLVRQFGRLADERGDATEPEPWPGKAAIARLLESNSDSDA